MGPPGGDRSQCRQPSRMMSRPAPAQSGSRGSAHRCCVLTAFADRSYSDSCRGPPKTANCTVRSVPDDTFDNLREERRSCSDRRQNERDVSASPSRQRHRVGTPVKVELTRSFDDPPRTAALIDCRIIFPSTKETVASILGPCRHVGHGRLVDRALYHWPLGRRPLMPDLFALPCRFSRAQVGTYTPGFFCRYFWWSSGEREGAGLDDPA